MLVRRVPLSRLFVLFVLVTAVLGLSAQKAFPQAESETPRPTERDFLPYRETETLVHQPEQFANATTLVPFSKIVFQTIRDLNDWEIFKSNDDGTAQVALTNNTIVDIHPRFNRGADRVVFARIAGTNDDFEIYSMNADGSGLSQLTNNSTDDANPYWSPDGTRIVFEAYRDGQAEIYVMNADGSNQIRLTYHSDFDGYPAWSPDGSKIAFSSRNNGAYRIYTMNPDGSNQVQRSTQPYSFHPVWSPDSTRIAFDADGNGNGWQEIWVVNADGSGQTQLFTPSDNQTDAWVRSWSPDGQYISFTQIHFIQYKGAWYWTSASNVAYHISSNTIAFLGSNNTNWNPDWQSTDGHIPVSQINLLPDTSPATFTASWTGSDEGISGLKSYDVQVKIDDGQWQDLLTDTIDTSITYTGVGGVTYSFRSRARDNAGNVEVWPNNADTVTKVEALPPITQITTLPSYSPAGGFFVAWGGQDPGNSGIQTYDVQYRQGNSGDWTNWQMGTKGGGAHFNGGNPGGSFSFRVRATDLANNIEAWPSGNGDTVTTLYAWAIRGRIVDNTGVPVVQAHSITNPVAASNLLSDEEGEYAAYVTAQANDYVVNWNKAGYGSPPDSTFPANAAGNLAVVMPPINDLLQNGGFETGSWTPWSVVGTGTPVLTSTNHTGEEGAYMGRPFALSPNTTSFQNGSFAQIAVGSDETVHMVWQGYHPQDGYSDIYYAYKNHNGEWSSPQNISNNSGHSLSPKLAIASNNRVSVVWVDKTPGNYEIFYSRQNNNGTWTTPKNLSNDSYEDLDPQIVIDKNNASHIVWSKNYTNMYGLIFYTDSSNGNLWSLPASITTDNVYGSIGYRYLLTDRNDDLHLIWTTHLNYTESRGYYAQRTGTQWQIEQITDDSYRDIAGAQAAVDVEGNVHIVWLRGNGNGIAHTVQYQIRPYNSSWSAPKTIFTNNQHHLSQLFFAIGPTGTGYITWDTADADVFMAQRDAYGTWSSAQDISSIFNTAPQLAEDSLGNLHGLWHIPTGSDSYQMSYTKRNRGGLWSTSQIISETSNGYGPFAHLLMSKSDNVHMVWSRDFLNQNYIDYRGSVLATEADAFALTQQFTIPLTITTPTLSFLYQLGGVSSGGDSALHVEVDDGSGNTSVLNLKRGTTGWTHAWADLSAWAGETVSITFQLYQADNEPYVWTYVDDVTVGTAYPDLWVAVDNTVAAPGEQVVHTLTYGNQSGVSSNNNILTYTLPAEISFVSATMPPTAVNNSTLSWNLTTLPPNSEPFTLVVTGTISPETPIFTYLLSNATISTLSELETLNNTAQGNTYIGRFLYLPAISKN